MPKELPVSKSRIRSDFEIDMPVEKFRSIYELVAVKTSRETNPQFFFGNLEMIEFCDII